MKIADKMKEEMLKELNKLREQMNQMNQIREKYEKTLETLRKKEEKYEFIVNAHSEYMSLINRKYKYEAVNDSYCLAVKKSREEFIGKTVPDLWGQENFEKNIKPNLDKCFNDEIVRYETRFHVGITKELFYAVNYYPYKNKKGEVTHVVAVTRDITDKKLAEIELIESEKMLKELNKQKDDYLAIMNSDLLKASNYLLSLVPQNIETKSIKTKWMLKPSMHLGGDSLGYNWLDNENLAIYILDVSGHGIGSALHSTSALTMLRFKTLIDADFYSPASVLESLNKTFNMHDHYNLYFTMWYCVLNIPDRSLNYAGAGHPPVILINKKNNPEFIEALNPVIGYSNSMKYQSHKMKIPKGSALYFYSDGAYEIKKKDGNMMSCNDLAEFLKEHMDEEGNEIHKLYQHLANLSNNKLEDDFLMLKIHV